MGFGLTEVIRLSEGMKESAGILAKGLMRVVILIIRVIVLARPRDIAQIEEINKLLDDAEHNI